MDIMKILPNINKKIKLDLPYIAPSANAHRGLSVPAIVFKHGSALTKFKSGPHLAKYLIGSVRELKVTYNTLYDQPKNPSLKITDEDMADLIAYSKTLGVNTLGFTQVDPSMIFSDKMILYKNAIVLVMEMIPEIIKTAPSKSAEKEIFRTYYQLGVAVNKIKTFLNARNYRAEAGPALGGEVNYPLLAQKAGLGVLGKHGLLITPDLGPSLRLAAIYTDIENLPVAQENKHLWIKNFCDKCNKCVRKCPAQAIYFESKIFEDGSKQHIDYIKCAVPFSRDHGCTICIKECVFFNGSYSKVKTAFLSK